MIREKKKFRRTQGRRVDTGDTVYRLDSKQQIDLSQSFKLEERDEKGNCLLSNGEVVPSWALARWNGHDAR